MTKLIYHSPSNVTNVSPFDDAILRVASGRDIKITSPYIGIGYLKRLIDVSAGWRLVSDIEAWLSSLSRIERDKAWDFIQSNTSFIHHYPAIHAKTVISSDKAYLGSSNLTTAGILGRTEMGVVVDSIDLVRELNAWFDEIWNISGPPMLEQGATYLFELAQQPAFVKKREEVFSSTALRVRAKLAQRTKSEIVDVVRSNPVKFPEPVSDLFEIIDLSKLDEYVYRLVLAFDFDSPRSLPGSSHLVGLTGLNAQEQTAIFKALREAGLIDATVDKEGVLIIKLNEDFEWEGKWFDLSKTVNIWERKAAHIGRIVKLPAKMQVIPDVTQNNEGRLAVGVSDAINSEDEPDGDMVELVPGEDHPFSTNVAFADVVYARLCEILAVNGGRLPMPESKKIEVLALYNFYNPLAFTFKNGDLETSSLEAISSVLDGCVIDLPSSPFKISFLLEEGLIKSNSGNFPQFPIMITLQESIDSSLFPLAFRAAEHANLRVVFPERYLLTEKQVNSLNRWCAALCTQVKGTWLTNDVMDAIYSVIVEEAHLHGNKIPYSKSKLQALIVERTNVKKMIVNWVFKNYSPAVKKLLHIASLKDGQISIVQIRLDLLDKYPKTKVIFDRYLIVGFSNNRSLDLLNQYGIFIGNDVSILAADLIYEAFIEMRTYWGRHIPIQEKKLLYKMISDKIEIPAGLVGEVLEGNYNNVPRVFYLDIFGAIQKGMIFVFLNDFLSPQDWDILPKARAAMTKIGEDKFAKLA